MEKWEEGYYITAVAGSDNLSSLVVMSKGTKFTQQSYKVGAACFSSYEAIAGALVCRHACAANCQHVLVCKNKPP